MKARCMRMHAVDLPKGPVDVSGRKALVRRLLAFWKEVLDLRDLYVDLTFKTLDEPGCYATVRPAVGGKDRGEAVMEVSLELLALSPALISETVCHELIHTLLWPLSYSVTAEALLSKSQFELVDDLMNDGDEAATYRLQRILTRLVRVPKELTDSPSSLEVKKTHRKTRRTAH